MPHLSHLFRQYDVIVAGGGIAGTMAAIAAVSDGCRVLLIERYAALGGMATLGLVQPITVWGIHGQYVIGGRGRRLIEKLSTLGSDAATPLSFYGPTCDDADYMKGPFLLPADIQSGDYIEIGMLGAYGSAMKTGFNGFGQALAVIVADEPMASIYRGDREVPTSDNVVSLR